MARQTVAISFINWTFLAGTASYRYTSGRPVLSPLLSSDGNPGYLQRISVTNSTLQLAVSNSSSAGLAKDLSSLWETGGRIEITANNNTWLFATEGDDSSSPYELTPANSSDVSSLFSTVSSGPSLSMVLDDGSVPTVRVEGQDLFYGGFGDDFQYRLRPDGGNWGSWTDTGNENGTLRDIAVGTRVQFRNGSSGTRFPGGNGHTIDAATRELYDRAPDLTNVVATPQENSIALSWDGIQNSIRVRYRREGTSSFTNHDIASSRDGSTGYVITGLDNNVSYEVRITVNAGSGSTTTRLTGLVPVKTVLFGDTVLLSDTADDPGLQGLNGNPVASFTAQPVTNAVTLSREAVSDEVGISDAISTALEMASSISEEVGLSEEVSTGFEVSISEGIGFSDSFDTVTEGPVRITGVGSVAVGGIASLTVTESTAADVRITGVGSVAVDGSVLTLEVTVPGSIIVEFDVGDESFVPVVTGTGSVSNADAMSQSEVDVRAISTGSGEEYIACVVRLSSMEGFNHVDIDLDQDGMTDAGETSAVSLELFDETGSGRLTVTETSNFSAANVQVFNASVEEESVSVEEVKVKWKTRDYDPLPVEVEGFEASTTGQLPRPTMRLANVLGTATGLVRAHNNLLGAKVTRWRTYARYLDNGLTPDQNAHLPKDVYFVDRKSEHTSKMIEWELASILDQQGAVLPARQVLRTGCTFLYRRWDSDSRDFDYTAVSCPYVGSNYYTSNDQPTSNPAEDRCSQQLTGCLLRFSGTIPMGGFPSVGRIVR